MKDKKIFIHIGMPRAGSTFLQQNVFPNISSKNIYSQPQKIKDKIIPKFIRRIWVKGYYTQSELEEFKKEFWEVIQSIEQDKILISQEGLGGYDFQAGRGNLALIMKALYNVIPDAIIIVVLREQTSWLKSLYYLAIKGGHYTSFKKFLVKDNNYWNVKLDELQHKNTLETINQYFDEIYAIRFELIKEDFNAYIKLFETIINEKINPGIDKKPVNKTLSEYQLNSIGQIGSFVGYDRIWKEKYTFIPGHFKTSLRSDGRLADKIKYFLFNLFRYSIYYIGVYAGKIAKKPLISKENKAYLESLFYYENKKFWNNSNLKKIDK